MATPTCSLHTFRLCSLMLLVIARCSRPPQTREGNFGRFELKSAKTVIPAR